MTWKGQRPHAIYRSVGKRLFDLTLLVITLPITVPLSIVVAALVRLVDGSPVLFRQARPGLHGQSFDLMKFRTMRTGASGGDAERITRLGRFLRSTSLDELPELWHVLDGNMSFVGPRPLLTEYLDRYSSDESRRHLVRPGLTGWAQVNGRNELEWPARLAMDVWYVDHISLRLDARIVARTLALVVSRKGISAPGHATMPEFLGSQDATEDV